MAGQKINDHSSWMGGKSKESPLPVGGAKNKFFSSAEGAGALSHYEDTTETVKSQQEMGKKKVQAYPQKAGHRN